MTITVPRALLFALMFLLAVAVGAIGTLFLTDGGSTDDATTDQSDQASAYVADEFLDKFEKGCLSGARPEGGAADYCACARDEFGDRFSTTELVDLGLRAEPDGTPPPPYRDDALEAARACRTALSPG